MPATVKLTAGRSTVIEASELFPGRAEVICNGYLPRKADLSSRANVDLADRKCEIGSEPSTYLQYHGGSGLQ